MTNFLQDSVQWFIIRFGFKSRNVEPLVAMVTNFVNLNYLRQWEHLDVKQKWLQEGALENPTYNFC